MPAEIDGLSVGFETYPLARGSEVIFLDLARVVGLARLRIGKHPILGRGWTLPFPVEQMSGEVRIHREIVFRISVFIHPSIHDFPRDSHGQMFEVDIRPLEGENFADSQPGALGHDRHGAKPLHDPTPTLSHPNLNTRNTSQVFDLLSVSRDFKDPQTS